ncbi:MAG: hypothetical protein U9Q76_11000 [candidate division WOR-3 bacterium]|nr:hypothetical protein [candidate division WOR-3 bacterium]
MRIMVRGKGEKVWKPLDESDYDSESHLQGLLNKDISLIPLDPPLLTCASEFGLPGSGATDIVAVDQDGAITIIECKLAKSREVRRMVIGQLLEYAAFLTKMSADEFVETFDDLADAPLYQTMAEKVEDFEESVFKENLTDNLKEGRFTLIVAVDRINDELREIILYLNAHSDCTVGALELEYFRDEQRELLVPHLYGGPEVKEASGRETSSGKTRRWDRDSFFKDAREEQELDEEYIKALEELLKFSQGNADEFVWGRGKTWASFGFKVLKGKLKLTIFYAYTDANININFSSLNRIARTADLEEFQRRLNTISGIKLEKKSFEHFAPWIDMEVFVKDKTALKTFKEAVLWMRDKIRSYDE